MTIVAEQIWRVSGAGDSSAEGVWRLWVDEPPRPIEVTLIPNGSHVFDKWIAAGVDKVLGRRIGGNGPTHAHALAEVAWGVAMWRAGKMPLLAVTGDPRIEPPPPRIVSPADAGVDAAIEDDVDDLEECADCGGSTAAGTPDPHECVTAAPINRSSATPVPPAGRAEKLAALAKARRTTKKEG